MASVEERLRLTHRWATAHGFFHGWPNFEQANYHDGRGVVYGTRLIRPGSNIEWRDVPRRELGAPELSNIEGCWRAAHRWAIAHGYGTGMPTFEQADYGNGVVYGIVLLKSPPHMTWQDVRLAELEGRPSFADPGGVIRSIDRWAKQHGFAAGFPNFEQADYRDGRGVVYGSFGFAPGDYLHWQDVPAHELGLAEPPVTRLRIMAWNILEGTGLQKVAATIRELEPDIVLLSEIRWIVPGFGANDQTSFLAAETGLKHGAYKDTTMMGLTGTKGVAILSRYPVKDIWLRRVKLLQPWPWPWGPMKTWIETSFGTMHATIRLDDLDHDVFSTRFAPMHPPGWPTPEPQGEAKNEAGHLQAIDMIKGIPAGRPVIFGGDLNARWKQKPWAIEFSKNSGLTDARMEKPDPEAPDQVDDRTDYIYYRGPTTWRGPGRDGCLGHQTMCMSWPNSSEANAAPVLDCNAGPAPPSATSGTSPARGCLVRWWGV